MKLIEPTKPSFLEARRLAHRFFPNWSRRDKAKWVRAKMIVGENKVKVPISNMANGGK